MTESLFGPIVTPWAIEQKTISTLRAWLPEYLAEIERKEGLVNGTIMRPPAAASYHGGVDTESWFQSDSPQVIVVVKPNGPPVLRGEGGYLQEYTLDVGCLCVETGSGVLGEGPGSEARAVAGYLASAAMLLVQHPSLGGLAEQLHMTRAPLVSNPEPDRKDIALGTVEFAVWISTIIEEGAGPAQEQPAESPQWKGSEEPYGGEPEAVKDTTTVKAVTVTETV